MLCYVIIVNNAVVGKVIDQQQPVGTIVAASAAMLFAVDSCQSVDGLVAQGHMEMLDAVKQVRLGSIHNLRHGNVR